MRLISCPFPCLFLRSGARLRERSGLLSRPDEGSERGRREVHSSAGAPRAVVPQVYSHFEFWAFTKQLRASGIAGLTRNDPSQVSLEGQMLWREFFYACGWGTPNFDKMARTAIYSLAHRCPSEPPQCPPPSVNSPLLLGRPLIFFRRLGTQW